MGDALGRMAMMGGDEGPTQQTPPAPEAMTVEDAKAEQKCPKCGFAFPAQTEGETETEGAPTGTSDVKAWFEQNHPATAMARGPMR